MYSIARACSTSSISDCTCGAHPDFPPDGNFKWGGCGDNVDYGMKFSKRFVDGRSQSTRRYEDKTKQKRTKKRSTDEDLSTHIQNHNSDVGRRVSKFTIHSGKNNSEDVNTVCFFFLVLDSE